MSVLELNQPVPRPGQIWKYCGENQDHYGEEYAITEILPSVKKPGWDWHRGVRYAPLEEVATAPNDYVRIDDDFLGCFRYVRG